MIETKTIRQNEKSYIEDMVAFGWQPTETVSRRAGRGYHINDQIMARDTSMPKYNDLRKLEIEYENVKSKILPAVEIDGLTALILFLLGIIPGIIYLVVKNKKKDEVNTFNFSCKRKMKELVKQAQSIY